MVHPFFTMRLSSTIKQENHCPVWPEDLAGLPCDQEATRFIYLIFSQWPQDWLYVSHLDNKGTDDKEDASNSLKKFISSPLEKFRGGQGYLSVSDLTAQFWCEQQMEYNYLAPEPKPESEPMQLGKNIHLARGKLLIFW